MRDIAEVIDAMVKEVPPEEAALVAALERVKFSAGFKAPELMRDCWVDLVDTLEEQVGVPDVPWKHKLAAIMAGN